MGCSRGAIDAALAAITPSLVHHICFNYRALIHFTPRTPIQLPLLHG